MSEILITPDQQELIDKVDQIDGKHLTLEQLAEAFPGHDALSRSIMFAARKPDPVGASCNPAHRAVHNSGRRPLSVISLQVIHDQESPTALAAAMWFTNPAAGGSATYTNDDYECFRCLFDNQIPWGAPGANYHGLHYEQAGFARYHTPDWMRHYRTIDRTAWKIARDARHYRIPIRWLTAADLRAGHIHGQTSHAQCTLAFGGSHTDPGRGYPKMVLMRRAHYHYQNLSHVKPLL